MPSRNTVNDSSGSGCAVIVIGLLLLAAAIWVFSSIGHFLGLTPTFDEVTDRPDGWVTRHYAGVGWGFLLTSLVLAVIAALAWLALLTQAEDQGRAAFARGWLPRMGGLAAVLLLLVVALPIGQRSGVETASGVTGSAGEGNVPDLVGMSVARADAALQEQDLVSDAASIASDNERCIVSSQDPAPGADLEEYSTVKLVCDVPVPDVTGQSAEVAESRLTEEGFSSSFVNEPSDYDLSRCRVRRQSPTVRATPHSSISLRLRCRRAPPEPEPTPLPDFEPEPEPTEDCDENYSGGCVPVYPPDVDCPDIDGSVEVTGEDVHALDREGDGNACE